MTDAELAAQIATEAGELLLAIQKSGLSGRELCNAGDMQANLLILARLRAERPGEAILSEESADDSNRLTQSRVWIIDPLDGTREFGEGRSDWAVHVALAIDGVAAVGAVALPGLGVTLSSDAPPPLKPAHHPPRMLVSRTRPSQLCADVCAAIAAETIGMGSAGAKAMAVVRGEAEIYLHSGGQHQWDNCAPAAVAAAAGLHVSRIDGSPIVYNQPGTSIPDLLICRRELAEQVLACVSAC
ncbi:MAG: 3'(2'),5'-bisphosphate nucleotidase CysQ [Sphingomonas sp.]